MYPLVHLQPGAARVCTFVLTIAAFSCAVAALAVCLSALADSSGSVTLLMHLVLLLWVLVGGFLVNPESIPVSGGTGEGRREWRSGWMREG
jgi:hypothetical protein